MEFGMFRRIKLKKEILRNLGGPPENKLWRYDFELVGGK